MPKPSMGKGASLISGDSLLNPALALCALRCSTVCTARRVDMSESLPGFVQFLDSPSDDRDCQAERVHGRRAETALDSGQALEPSLYPVREPRTPAGHQHVGQHDRCFSCALREHEGEVGQEVNCLEGKQEHEPGRNDQVGSLSPSVRFQPLLCPSSDFLPQQQQEGEEDRRPALEHDCADLSHHPRSRGQVDDQALESARHRERRFEHQQRFD